LANLFRKTRELLRFGVVRKAQHLFAAARARLGRSPIGAAADLLDKLEPGAYTISAAIETGGRIGAEVSARIRIR